MDKYKLYNTIKRDLLRKKGIKKSDIKLRKFSFNLLNELLDKYAVVEYVESQYCCMGEDKCCWQDVNWSNKGWVSYPEKSIPHYLALKSAILADIKYYKKHLYGRKIFYIESRNYIWINIPLRDVAKSDYSIIFNRTKPVKDLL